MCPVCDSKDVQESGKRLQLTMYTCNNCRAQFTVMIDRSPRKADTRNVLLLTTRDD